MNDARRNDRPRRGTANRRRNFVPGSRREKFNGGGTCRHRICIYLRRRSCLGARPEYRRRYRVTGRVSVCDRVLDELRTFFGSRKRRGAGQTLAGQAEQQSARDREWQQKSGSQYLCHYVPSVFRRRNSPAIQISRHSPYDRGSKRMVALFCRCRKQRRLSGKFGDGNSLTAAAFLSRRHTIRRPESVTASPYSAPYLVLISAAAEPGRLALRGEIYFRKNLALSNLLTHRLFHAKNSSGVRILFASDFRNSIFGNCARAPASPCCVFPAREERRWNGNE